MIFKKNMTGFYRMLLVAIMAAFNAFPAMCSQEGKNRILIVADEWPQMHALAQEINDGNNFKIDSAGQENLPADLKCYDFVFMYFHKVLKEGTEKALIGYTNQGGTLIVLHHGIASAKMKNPAWMDFVGVEILPRGGQNGWDVLQDTTHTMVNLSPGHFITTHKIKYGKNVHFETDYSDNIKGEFPAFDLLETEIFVNQRFTDIKKKNLLFGFVAEGHNIMQPTSGWYQKKGKGWLFYYQPGHQTADFQNENFRQVILNTLDWGQ